MNRNSSVSSRVRMCWPSTSASAISTILWYRSLAMSNSSPMPVPKAEMSAWTSLLPRIRSMRAFSTLRILPRIGRIAWVSGSRPPLAEPPAESPSTMKISQRAGSLSWQSESLPGRRAGLQQALAPGRLAGLACGHPGRCGVDRLADHVAGLVRVGAEPVPELVGHHPLHEALDLAVAQLGLGLALELRLAQLDRQDRGQALADVVAGEVLVLLLEQAACRARSR